MWSNPGNPNLMICDTRGAPDTGSGGVPVSFAGMSAPGDGGGVGGDTAEMSWAWTRSSQDMTSGDNQGTRHQAHISDQPAHRDPGVQARSPQTRWRPAAARASPAA